MSGMKMSDEFQPWTEGFMESRAGSDWRQALDLYKDFRTSSFRFWILMVERVQKTVLPSELVGSGIVIKSGMCIRCRGAWLGAALEGRKRQLPKMQGVVEFVRDLQVVSRYHIDKLMGMSCLYPCSTISSAFPSLCPPSSPLKSLADLAQVLRNTLEVLQETAVAETLGVMRVRGGDEVKPLVEFGPYSEWNTRVMLSKIAYLYLRKMPRANASEFHVLDYLLTDHESLSKREPVFSDGKGIVLIRQHMESLGMGRHVDIAVVNAFARVCNNLTLDRVGLTRWSSMW